MRNERSLAPSDPSKLLDELVEHLHATSNDLTKSVANEFHARFGNEFLREHANYLNACEQYGVAKATLMLQEKTHPSYSNSFIQSVGSKTLAIEAAEQSIAALMTQSNTLDLLADVQKASLNQRRKQRRAQKPR